VPSLRALGASCAGRSKEFVWSRGQKKVSGVILTKTCPTGQVQKKAMKGPMQKMRMSLP
jgi:hypothetical protein